MGINKIAALSKAVAVFPEKDLVKGNYTAHSFRRSAATALAEAGISVVALYHTGMWRSLKTAQEYHSESSRQKVARVEILDETIDSPPKKQRVLVTESGVGGGGTAHGDSAPSVVHGNYIVINAGESAGGFSFLNGGGLSAAKSEE